MKYRRHGKTRTRAHVAWTNMKARCNNPRHPNYSRYGGRGIGYDSRWEEFLNFYEDMGDPGDGLTLERIDNDKGYSKENCCWATQYEQTHNMSSVKLSYEIADEIRSLDFQGVPNRAISTYLGINPSMVKRVLYLGAWARKPEGAVS